jgi:hypothetical protein
MNEMQIEDMTAEAFEQTLEDFITREQTEVPVSDFFEALALIDQKNREQARMIRLRTRIVDGEIVFSQPEPEDAITVEGNEIVLEDGRRILLELASDQTTPASSR